MTKKDVYCSGKKYCIEGFKRPFSERSEISNSKNLLKKGFFTVSGIDLKFKKDILSFFAPLNEELGLSTNNFFIDSFADTIENFRCFGSNSDVYCQSAGFTGDPSFKIHLIRPQRSSFPSKIVSKNDKEIWDGTASIQRIRVPYSKELSRICYLSNRLYNFANWLVRMRYFFLLKPDNLKWLKGKKIELFKEHAKKKFSSMAALVREFKEIQHRAIEKYHQPSGKGDYYKIGVLMFYNELYSMVKFTDQYKSLPAQVAQRTLKILETNWLIYFRNKEDYFKDPEKYQGIPSIPAFRKDKKRGRNYEFVAIFPSQLFHNPYQKDRFLKTTRLKKSKTTAELLFPKNANISKPVEIRIDIPNLPIKPSLKIKNSGQKIYPLSNLKEVRIVPRRSHYIIEVISQLPFKDLKLDKNRVATVDIGQKVLMAIATNIGTNPILIRGSKVNHANWVMNREVAKLQSQLAKSRSNAQSQRIKLEIDRVRARRYYRVQDQLHKASRYLIDYCIKNNIGTIVVGYNEEWKQKVNLGRVTNQTFVFVPHRNLLDKIKYKAQLVGIKFIKGDEGYTSKCSALDNEPIQKKVRYDGIRAPTMKGRTKSYQARGLYKTRSGKYIHSDVNGAFNIGRKALPNAFRRVSQKDMLLSPIGVVV